MMWSELEVWIMMVSFLYLMVGKHLMNMMASLLMAVLGFSFSFYYMKNLECLLIFILLGVMLGGVLVVTIMMSGKILSNTSYWKSFLWFNIMFMVSSFTFDIDNLLDMNFSYHSSIIMNVPLILIILLLIMLILVLMTITFTFKSDSKSMMFN